MLFAQAPVNDNCANASLINIPMVNYGLGIYYSDTIDLTNATLQIGEVFHNVQVSAGTDKKTIWFKFHLPTARSVDLELMQPGNSLPEDAAGFTVYYSGSCIPGLAAIPGAKLTPLNKFGSSYNPCLLPGDYLVQVSSKTTANDSVFMKLTVDEPMVLNVYDRPIAAQNMGTLSDGWHNYTFDVGCQTIENDAESCPNLGANYQEYTQSTWHVFQTDHFVDLVRWELHEAYNHYTGNLNVGFNLYLGDARTMPIASMTIVDGCRILHPSGVSGLTPYYAGVSWLCELLPDTTYSLQVFYHKDYSNTIEFRWYERGSGNTHSPDPSAIDPFTQLGTLPSSAAGTWTYGHDTLSCNAFIADHQCGTVNPAAGIVSFGSYSYNMSTWYTFTVAAAANVRFQTSGNLGKRLFLGDVGSDCNLVPVWQFTNSDITYPCLPAGTYSFQLLGKLDTSANIASAFYNNIGQAADLNIQVTEVNIATNFQLDATGRIDSVNSWNPLTNGVQTFGDTAYFGCPNTVLPAGTICSGGGGLVSRKAIYREIVIDTVGILTIGGGNYYFNYKFFAGDASALATAQGAFSYSQTITGMTEMTGCTDLYWSNPKICVVPGIYTLVSYGDSTDVGRYDHPWFRFDKIYTQFYNPAAPNNMGDVTAGIQSGTITGTVDYFSCIDNPLTIDGRTPCSGYTKQIYREFYVGQPLIVNISTTSGTFRLFEGRISDGVGTLSYDIDGYGDLGCRSSFYTNVCKPLMPGWYTVVVYGYGGVYTGPTYTGGHIGQSNNISIWTTTPLNPALYNRPHKAYDAGITDFGPNAGSNSYPNRSRNYTFGTDRFDCVPDTPFISHPVVACPSGFNRVSYFVFELTKESFVSIKDIPSSMISRVYPFDVRADSVLMMSVNPVQPCIVRADISHYERSWWTWTGKIEFCRLQPGKYTLVVFAGDAHINTTLRPTMYVDTVETSRFDWALHAYDFDSIPGDSVFYYGKLGDTNPLDASRTATNDFFSCTTGAWVSDPGLTDPQNLCWNGLFPYTTPQPSILYPIDIDECVYDTIGTTNVPVRRNLWYTFVIDGPGRVYVSVENKTPSKSTPVLPFTVYYSDVDGTLPFSSVIAGGELDSTYTQGLTYILNNSTFDWYGCAGNLQTINFPISPCDPSIKRRYYIVVDEHAGIMPVNQIEVGVRFDPVPVTPLFYDHYSYANDINGLNEANPPYTPVQLVAGTYNGDPASFACATKDVPDQNSCGTRTLWYKFTSAISGKLRINYTIDGVNTYHNANEMMLFREIIPGDSTLTGLQLVTRSNITALGKPWGESCLNPRTYYIMMTGCSYTIESVVPTIWLIDEYGDLCTNPVPINISAPGTASGSVVIDCHSIGEAYGEDGSAMGCLFGPAGYKSTWFKVNLNLNITVDLSFQLSEATSALPSQIRYRILYGTCNSMTAGPCNSDALTEFTLNCMATDSNDYYVQVVSPIASTGTLTLTVQADSAPNQSCEPFNPVAPVANFTVNNGCAGDSICFVNQSTQGDSISYFWDFGEAILTNDTSDLENPCWLYPIPPTSDTVMYQVMLIVTNIINGIQDTIVIGVPVYPVPFALITRDPPQDGYYVSAGGPVNFYSNSSNTITIPPAIWIWDLSNGTFSNDTNPQNVIYGPSDLGLNIVELQLVNGACTVVVYDTFFVKYEDIYKGGYYDGADSSVIASYCPPDSVWNGGFYDGVATAQSVSTCIPDSVWNGGFYDGVAAVQSASACPPDSAWNGGFFDGSVAGFTPADCPPDSVWNGGEFDGSSVNIQTGFCPPDSIWSGGFYDGASEKASLANCPTEIIFGGGFNDGATMYLSSTCNPLPVELLALKAFWLGNDGVIQWITASEINNKGFYIQRMNSAGVFSDLVFIAGAGNSNIPITYSWLDKNLMAENADIFYYRLRQVDNDGGESITEMVSLSKSDAGSSGSNDISVVRLFPNPSMEGNDLQLLLSCNVEGTVSVQIFDKTGKMVYDFQNSVSIGLNWYSMPVVYLQSGAYSVVVSIQENSVTLPLIITK